MSTTPARRPLDGIKVLDFTHGVAGPYAAMLLGDMGAEVVKIEYPERGDSTRYMNVAERFTTEIPKAGGDYFLAISRNKKSVCIDMKTPEGAALCRRLARWADVSLQSFRPGVMKRLGLDYPALRAENPKLLYANISAYGSSGPLTDKAGMDVAVQARSGVMLLTGAQGSKEPVRPGASLADFSGGIYLYAAVMTALYDRERTGEGQEIDLSLMDATMSMLINYSVAVMDGAAALAPVGSGHPQLCPYQAFPTKDGYVVIGAGTNKVYRELCECLGRPDLGREPRFHSNELRVRHRAELIALLEPLFLARTSAEWLEKFDAADIPSAPVHDMAQAYDELQRISPHMVCEVAHPVTGPLHVLGVPFRYSAMRGDVRLPPPCLGEHTDAVLGAVLGLSAAELEQLRERKVIG
ncbi:MAG: CoA transferase [Burkholderiales bacterium]|nr:CoA transferase [Burkholderiales bacterium]